jgi:hypothetical protein
MPCGFHPHRCFLDFAHTAVYRRYLREPRQAPPNKPEAAATLFFSQADYQPKPTKRSVKATLQRLSTLLHQQDPRLLASIGGSVVVLILATILILRLRRPSAAEIERRRREHLALTGRITDGVIVDARTLSGDDSISPTPEVLVYTYRLAGVTYNCAQDVSLLGERIVGFRIDQPVQLRYDPRNPGNSILVSETWTGLWQSREG